MINPYLNNYEHNNTHNLIEDLIIQSIQMTGTEIILFNRDDSETYDYFLNEDPKCEYKKSIRIESYIANVQEFNGVGNQLSFFGLELKDKIDFIISKKRYSCMANSEYGNRPLEGYLIYLPLNNSIYEIAKVTEDDEFLRSGNNFIWKLSCELFNPSNEDIDFNRELNDDGLDVETLVNNFEGITHNDLESPIENTLDSRSVIDLQDINIKNPLGNK